VKKKSEGLLQKNKTLCLLFFRYTDISYGVRYPWFKFSITSATNINSYLFMKNSFSLPDYVVLISSILSSIRI